MTAPPFATISSLGGPTFFGRRSLCRSRARPRSALVQSGLPCGSPGRCLRQVRGWSDGPTTPASNRRSGQASCRLRRESACRRWWTGHSERRGCPGRKASEWIIQVKALFSPPVSCCLSVRAIPSWLREYILWSVTKTVAENRVPTQLKPFDCAWTKRGRGFGRHALGFRKPRTKLKSCA